MQKEPIKEPMSFKSDEEAHDHYTALVKSSSEAIVSFTKDLNGTILTWNKGAEKAYGYLANEVIGCNIAILLPPDHPNDIPDVLEQIKRGESIENYETVRMTKAGARLNVSLNVSPIRNAEGSIIGASAITRDITELKRAEEALRESEQRFSAFMLNLPAAAWIKDLKGRYVYVNAQAEQIFLRPLHELQGKTDFEIFSAETARKFVENDQRALSEGGIRTTEVLRHADGIDHLSIVNKFAVIGAGGQPAYIAGVAFDITELKQAEEALRKSHDELEMRVKERTGELHALASHLQSIREEERTVLARDIHDELGQELIVLKMELARLADKCGDHSLFSEITQAMLHSIDITLSSVKRICTELRPSLLDDFGLITAIEWQTKEFEKRTGIECSVTGESKDMELEKELTIGLYRIVQEALTNAAKHSEATKITIRLTRDNGFIRLEVSDNGKGITDKDLSKVQTFGLIGMRERVFSFNGDIDISGSEGKGTTIKVSIPVP